MVAYAYKWLAIGFYSKAWLMLINWAGADPRRIWRDEGIPGLSFYI